MPLTKAEKAHRARRDAIAEIIYPGYAAAREAKRPLVGPAFWADEAERKADAILALTPESIEASLAPAGTR